MAISEKDRKSLWARSGNRCAFCRIELIAEKDDNEINLNLGEECHIISSKHSGPRFKEDFSEGHDNYSNLILLCRNHHRMIDEQFETYTANVLNQIKLNHERWVKTIIDKASGKKTKNEIRLLSKITCGKELLDIVIGMHASQFDYDELKSEEEVQTIGSFLQNLSDWGEILGVGINEHHQIAELGFNLTKDIKEIENLGFFVFGDSRRSRMTNDNKVDLGVWKIATIYIMRKDNPNIINMDLSNKEKMTSE
jgi:hypothetical protein